MGEPTRWQLELGDKGEVPPLPGDSDGVFRISCGDFLMFTLPAGSLPTLVGSTLMVARDELAKETIVEVTADEVTKDAVAEWCPAWAGPYEIFLRYPIQDKSTEGKAATNGNGLADSPVCRIVVDPVLRINSAPLPARAIVQLTVLSRCGGPIEEWPEMLAPQALAGYNMVHFTPIQPPGESGSCYALDDQNSIDPTLMKAPAETHAERLKAVKLSVDRLEKEHGLLSAMDIVLNHTAGSAPWLLEHPESAYSVSNSPHLTVAAELDDKLAWYSEELRRGKLGGPHINTDDDVGRVADGVRHHVLQPLRLREYFTVDTAGCVGSFAAAAARFEREDYQAVKDGALPQLGISRKGVIVAGEVARRFCRDEGTLRDWLQRLQNELFTELGHIENDIVDAVCGTVRYERLELRRGPIGKAPLQLVQPYFRRLQLSSAAQLRLGRETENVLHNGWVMNWPATEDFAAPSWRFVYLRRHLCVWGDCVKLRFGSGPADAPYLWEHMTQYTVSMAGIFHAIRLDNAHSTPLHVSQHMLAQARKTNPSCWIFAELFTGSFQTDLLYLRTLGINALIREGMQCDSPDDFAGKLASSLWGAHPIGALSLVPTLDRELPLEAPRTGPWARGASVSCALLPSRAMPLRPRSVPALLFDCTHDNQTPLERRNPRDALPNAALVAASCASIGSVRGYDELLAKNPSVVFERRTYQKIAGVKPFQLGWPAAEAPAPEQSEASRLEFFWPHGASRSVEVRGSWDGWASGFPLMKQSDGRWSASMSAPAASMPLVYKFIVDGNWTIDGNQPTSRDSSGNTNNVLHGQAGETNGSAAHMCGPDVSLNSLPGILTVKQALNALHVRHAREGFVEIGVRKLAGDILAVERRAPDSGMRTFFIVRTAFSRHGLDDQLPWDLALLEIPGSIAQFHVAATLFVPDKQPGDNDAHTIRGMDCYLQMYGSLSDVAHVWQEGGSTKLKLTRFPPGSVLAFSTSPAFEVLLRTKMEGLLTHEALGPCLEGLALSDLNYLLFSCDAEERDSSGGERGNYGVPGYGPFMYCGLMGVCGALDIMRSTMSDLQNCPIVDNIRQGDWLLGYLADRLGGAPSLARVKEWLGKVKDLLSKFPRQIVPFYFDLATSSLCATACDTVFQASGAFISQHRSSGRLVRDLALATVQFWGAVPSAPLHWDRAKELGWRAVPSLCAGLPHFATGFMRNWGRDTFIALRGCLLITQRFAEARATLLVFASVIRHGLCPNLLDAANNPRYNARDATWFFLQAIQDYVEMSPEGEAFLKEPVALKWPVSSWDSQLSHLEPRTMADLIHLILAAHAKGVAFREWNAGKRIDEHMTDEGFNISVSLDEATGIIYGGNAENCGTWMDKMGSSEKAGNKGSPATPRDGAAVEIIGLLKSTLRWVSSLSPSVFPHESVRAKSGADLKYKEWDAKLQQNFEKVFWLGPRTIYKDSDGATRKWQDSQLRPNFPIAMAVAPELFTPGKAQAALEVVAEKLIGPLGMCTLDPSDKEYRGDYHNDDDSTDKAVAHGWNYHQGPEWVWPLGFFLRAWHRFGGSPTQPQSASRVLSWLLNHREMLSKSPWRSLPELTNSQGKECHHSCPAQAWSLACLLDAAHTVRSASRA